MYIIYVWISLLLLRTKDVKSYDSEYSLELNSVIQIFRQMFN